MIKQFQEGKRYKLSSPHSPHSKETEFLCLTAFVSSKGTAMGVLEGSPGVFVAEAGGAWNIVPPKPRTGVGFAYTLDDGKIILSTRKFYSPLHIEEIPITWTEVLGKETE